LIIGNKITDKSIRIKDAKYDHPEVVAALADGYKKDKETAIKQMKKQEELISL
jgi:hypothetical protein